MQLNYSFFVQLFMITVLFRSDQSFQKRFGFMFNRFICVALRGFLMRFGHELRPFFLSLHRRRFDFTVLMLLVGSPSCSARGGGKKKKFIGVARVRPLLAIGQYLKCST